MESLSESAGQQGRLWTAGAADWVTIQEPLSVPLWNAVLDDLGPVDSVLDAGCGAGGAALEALRRGIPVQCFDPSAGFVDLARARGIDVKTGEMESIPFGNSEFEASMANNSLQFTANPTAALFELKRVTSGRIGIAIWGPEEKNDIRRVFEAVVALFPKRPSGHGAFALTRPGLLEMHLSAAGLQVSSDRLFEGVFEYPSMEVALRGQMSAGPSQRAAEILGVGRLQRGVESALEGLQAADGGVRMRYAFRIVIANRS